MPNLIMASAFAMLFFTLFSNSETGPINSILLKLGIVAEPVRWLSNVWTARGLVGLMNFLMWFGNTTIILMAAIMRPPSWTVHPRPQCSGASRSR